MGMQIRSWLTAFQRTPLTGCDIGKTLEDRPCLFFHSSRFPQFHSIEGVPWLTWWSPRSDASLLTDSRADRYCLFSDVHSEVHTEYSIEQRPPSEPMRSTRHLLRILLKTVSNGGDVSPSWGEWLATWKSRVRLADWNYSTPSRFSRNIINSTEFGLVKRWQVFSHDVGWSVVLWYAAIFHLANIFFVTNQTL